MIAIQLIFSTLLLTACGNKQITSLQVEKIKIPADLLELRELKKPVAENEKDIIKAYIDLFQSYKECEININKIKELNKN